MNALLNEIRACQLCTGQLPGQPRPIVQFHQDSRILIAGQAPGRLAEERGKPFADPSGVRLRRWLGVSEEQFYNVRKFAIVPMGFCYPGSGSSGDLPPRPECAPAWRQRILSELKNIELTLVIGQYAQRWYFADEKIKSVTGLVEQWRKHWPRLLPTPHPSPRNIAWFKKHPWFEGEVIPALQNQVATILN